MAKYRDGARVATSLFEAAAFRYAVGVRCRGCGHGAVFDPHALWWLFRRKGWDEALGDAPKRFRCLRCGASGVALRLVRETPTADTLPMPPAAEWKRAVNRFRN